MSEKDIVIWNFKGYCIFGGYPPITTMRLIASQTAKFMGPTWVPPGSCRPQMGPMLAPWTLLSGFTKVKTSMQSFMSKLFSKPYAHVQLINAQCYIFLLHQLILMTIISNVWCKINQASSSSALHNVAETWLCTNENGFKAFMKTMKPCHSLQSFPYSARATVLWKTNIGLHKKICGYVSIKILFYHYRNSHDKDKDSLTAVLYITGNPMPWALAWVLSWWSTVNIFRAD